MEYRELLASKMPKPLNAGIPCEPSDLNPSLFDFQAAVTAWAIRQGRAALFLDTGLGKTPCQVEFCRVLAPESSIIFAPLSVAKQTIREAKNLLGIEIKYVTEPVPGAGIHITNYEHAHKFINAGYRAVVLDESSILKSFGSKTRQLLTEGFSDSPYRLACTATPAPNDVVEIVYHAEFLGICRGIEAQSTYFSNKGGGSADWSLKGHAVNAFYSWLATWAMVVRNPRDIGFDGSRYELPPLNIENAIVAGGFVREGELFAAELKGITDRISERKQTVDARTARLAELVNSTPGQWVVWCALNDESKAAAGAIDDAIEVSGDMSADEKESRIADFVAGKFRVLVSKPKICGFGMNFQNCHQQAFNGIGDSWGSYYQCIRRSWRFGQQNPVRVVIVSTDAEQAIVQNIERKESQALEMGNELVKRCSIHQRKNIERKASEMGEYTTREKRGENWRFINGDCVEESAKLEDESVDLSVFSPPFISLYTYTNTPRDMGNSRDESTFFEHFRHLIRELFRVTKTGRIAAVHVAQVPAMQVRDGWQGIKDFRGQTIQEFTAAGFNFHGECAIDKDPQAQAIRTKSLLFVQGKKDSSWLRPALADYMLIFRKPGEPAERINALRDPKTNPTGWISADEWIEWARPIWYGIKESGTLNVVEARSDDDEKHLAALQLETIHRAVMLWSKPGELVFSPFGGIGSEGYQSILDGRRYIGIELKAEYWEVGAKNLAKAERKAMGSQRDMFSALEDPDDSDDHAGISTQEKANDCEQ